METKFTNGEAMGKTMITGTSVLSAYNKDKQLGIAVNKSFMVPIEHIFIESGFNVRDLDTEHIEQISEAYAAGDQIPALTVKTTKDGFKIIDGHHRFEAAKIAGVTRLKCDEFTGSEMDQIAHMVKSSQGRNLKPVERAGAYRRMVNMGMTKQEIAKSVMRSTQDIDNHLTLLEAGDDVISAVKDGVISATNVISEVRKNGAAGVEKLTGEVSKAREIGGKAQTKKFKAKHQRRVMEILSTMDLDGEIADLVELWKGDNK